MPGCKTKALKDEVKKLCRRVRYLEKKVEEPNARALEKSEKASARLDVEVNKWRTKAKRLEEKGRPLPPSEKARVELISAILIILVIFDQKL